MSRSTRLTLICHGATRAVKSAGFPADEALLDGEIEVGSRIRTALPHAQAVVSAPELRTRQTAEMLADDFVIDPLFRDIDFGRWAGRNLAEVQESEPENLMSWISAVEAAPHGGESIADASRRIASWLDGQIEAGGHTIVITHAAIIRGAIASALDAPTESFWKIDVRPWSMTELSSDGRRWALRSFGVRPD